MTRSHDELSAAIDLSVHRDTGDILAMVGGAVLQAGQVVHLDLARAQLDPRILTPERIEELAKLGGSLLGIMNESFEILKALSAAEILILEPGADGLPALLPGRQEADDTPRPPALEQPVAETEQPGKDASDTPEPAAEPEPAPSPAQANVRFSYPDLAIDIDGTKYSAEQLGIRGMHEVFIIESFPSLEGRPYSRKSMYDLGFSANSSTWQSRDAAFSKANTALRTQLETAFGFTLIEEFVVDSSSRAKQYTITKPFTVNGREVIATDPEFLKKN